MIVFYPIVVISCVVRMYPVGNTGKNPVNCDVILVVQRKGGRTVDRNQSLKNIFGK